MSRAPRWTEDEKAAARYQMVLAISRGDLVRPDACEGCGRMNCRISGHHDDYDQPLQVRWLCGYCHEEAHEDMRRRGLLLPHPRLLMSYNKPKGNRTTTFQAARMIGCTSADVRRLWQAGEIEGKRIGFRVWVGIPSVRRYVRNMRRQRAA